MSCSKLSPLVLCAALIAGCSDDAIDAATFIAEYPAAMCDYHFACCDSGERAYNASGPCETQMKARVSELLAFTSFDQAFASFDGAAAAECLGSLRAMDCSTYAVTWRCHEQVTRAQHTVGESCRTGAECDSLFCDQPAKGKQGTCGAQGSGKCSGDDRSCNEGSYCAGGTQCVPKKAGAEVCNGPNECISGVCSIITSPHSCTNAGSGAICDGT